MDESATDGIDGTGELYRLPASRWVTMMRDAAVLGGERGSQLSSSTLSVIFYHVRRERMGAWGVCLLRALPSVPSFHRPLRRAALPVGPLI